MAPLGTHRSRVAWPLDLMGERRMRPHSSLRSDGLCWLVGLGGVVLCGGCCVGVGVGVGRGREDER